MSEGEVDRYLASLDEPKRSTLVTLRSDILEVVPEAEQCISYRRPAFRVQGKVVAGFAAFKNHLSYLPHSGSVFGELEPELEGYTRSSGALRFAMDVPLPKALVRKLVTTRIRQAFGDDGVPG
ncbi:MAG: iron chaperone [Gemmatimonadales bacterium]